VATDDLQVNKAKFCVASKKALSLQKAPEII
jgi:hypothetical protein